MNLRLLSFILVWFSLCTGNAVAEPVRVLFLGHESKLHNSNEYYPILSKSLGRDAIYFDYVTSVNQALDNADYLNQFDALLLYANHPKLSSVQWKNLLSFVRSGKGFVPIHCASWCFSNMPHNLVVIAPGTYEEVGQATDLMMAKPGAVARNYVPENAKVIAQTPMVLPGTKYDLIFQVPTKKGNYPFLCTFPGHWRLMKGELIVQP